MNSHPIWRFRGSTPSLLAIRGGSTHRLMSRVLLDSLVDAVDLLVAVLQELRCASDVLRQILQVVHETRLADVVAHVLDVLRMAEGEKNFLVTRS